MLPVSIRVRERSSEVTALLKQVGITPYTGRMQTVYWRNDKWDKWVQWDKWFNWSSWDKTGWANASQSPLSSRA